MTPSIYIFGSSRELDRCEAAMEFARSLDLVVTYAWPVAIRASMAAGKTDADLTPHERQRHALLDYRGVVDCRVAVGLLSDNESEMRWEFGAAFALRKPVVLSRETCKRVRLFDALGTECATDRAAIVLAKHLATPRAVEAGPRG